MSYNPTFAISFINTNTGAAIIDAGTSDLKTAKGAARNWYKNIGHVIDSWFFSQGTVATSNPLYNPGPNFDTYIKIIARPIVCKDDAINMIVDHIPAQQWIQREERFGATVLSMDDLF